MIISQSRVHTYTVPIVTFCLAAACVLLLVFTQQALSSAADALSLFATRVLPALFPFYVLTSMLFRTGAFATLNRICRGAFLPCFLMGGVAGNPNGARLCVLLDREEYAAACNLVSPMFLMGVVAIGMCGSEGLFWPLAIAHYGSALLLLPVARMMKNPAPVAKERAVTDPSSGRLLDIFSDIGGGALAMLNIGGCIVFFYVLADTCLTALVSDRFPLLSAAVVGVMEMTAGAARVAALPLPIAVQAGMLAFIVTFGGVCVFAQVMITAPLRRPGAYLLQKLMQACVAGILAYLLTPLFPAASAPAWVSSADEFAQNALIGITFLLCAGVGLVTSYLMALLIKKARAGSPGSGGSVNNLRPRPRRRPPR